jgi:LCP family protein required for cell wall assembly
VSCQLPEFTARRTWPQRALISLNICLIVISLLTAGGLAYFYGKVRAIGRVELGNSLTPVDKSGPRAAENILIVGTDSGEGLDPKDPVLIGRPGGLRSDTIMVLRIDPASDRALLLSLPRDLYVPIAGTRGSDRINIAIQGGPTRLIETIKNDLGIPINHYIEMNFFAFRSVVAAIDGVPIYFTTPVRDIKTGLNIPEAGCVTLDPVQALAFARSRAYEYFQSGRWRTDPTGDLGRISRQQEFIRKVIRRAIDKGARNPAVLNDLINAGTAALHLDPTITPGDLIDIGKRFKDFNPDNLETFSVPVTPATKGGGSVLLMKASEAEPILNLFRGVDANANDSILVLVQNGTLTAGMGAIVADQLRQVGFSIPDVNVTNATSFDYAQTTIRYLRGSEGRAQQVASYLVVPPVIEEVSFLIDTDVTVVVGSDWQGVRSSPGPTVPLSTTTTGRRTTTTTTTTTTTVPGGASPSSTTSTTVGVVPQTPQDVHC